MIPDLPPSVSDKERLSFYSTLWGNLSDQSSVHVNWHTHRQNPSVCWICDLFNLTSKVLDIAAKDNTKSTLDIKTGYSSEDVSDSEIESDIDYNMDDEEKVHDNTYNEPEYDVDDDHPEDEREV